MDVFGKKAMEEIQSWIEARKRHLQSMGPHKPAQELLKEIAFLDMEVMNMEKHILSMYQETYDKTAPSFTPVDDDKPITSRLAQVVRDNPTNKYTKTATSFTPTDDSITSRLPQVDSITSRLPRVVNTTTASSFDMPITSRLRLPHVDSITSQVPQVVKDNPTNKCTKTASSFSPMDDVMPFTSRLPEFDSITSRLPQVVKDNPTNKYSSVGGSQPRLHSSILYRSHSSLSQNESYRTSHPRETNAKAMHSFHSLPLSARELAPKDSNVTLAEHLATAKSLDHARQTPNRLSEEMVKCITAIYCQLAEPPLFKYRLATSPISFASSMSESPPQVQYDRGTEHRRNSSYNTLLCNPLHVDEIKEINDSYSAVVEIQAICLDASRLTGVEQMLQNFWSLVAKLDKVDPRNLKHKEKLAFWINIHNVLVMHVFLVNGIPQNNLKRNSLVIEAAYNIGGHTVTVDMIQSSILGCRMPRPRQWFQSLFFGKSKLKDGEVRKAYAIGSPQPLVKFALASGSYSDPMVRIYTPKRLLQELEMAKQEFIQTTCKIENEQTIFLPKIVDSYAKELGLCSGALFQMIAHSTSYYILQKCIHQPLQEDKLSKNIEWIPHNFNFRYLFAPELAKAI